MQPCAARRGEGRGANVTFVDPVWLSVILAAYAGSATLTLWLRPVLQRCGAVTRPGPDNIGRAVPRGGGLAIVVAVLLSACLFLDSPRLLLGWAAPALVVAVVSLRDDCRTVPAMVRLAVHASAAVAVLWVNEPLGEVALGELGRVSLGLAAWPLSVIWIVGMTNAFNFMDGIDGIAGLTAIAAGASLAVAALAVGCEAVAVVAGAFAAAAAGFLSWNWPPARIFMGDVGSTFCGFTIAALPLVVPSPGRMTVVPVVALAMWPFVFDAATTLLNRVMRRENVLETHESHIYQRLVIGGWSHRSVALLYGALALAGGGLAAASLVAPAWGSLLNKAAAGMVLVVPAVLVSAVSVADRGTACRAVSP